MTMLEIQLTVQLKTDNSSFTTWSHLMILFFCFIGRLQVKGLSIGIYNIASAFSCHVSSYKVVESEKFLVS